MWPPLRLSMSRSGRSTRSSALNQGLTIARDRGYAVAIALLTLQACTMLIIPPPPCVTGLARLGAKAVPFFKKLSKLERSWPTNRTKLPCGLRSGPWRSLEFSTFPISERMLFLFPNQANTSSTKRSLRLPIRREGSKSSSDSDLSSPEALGDGQDLKKCNVSHFDTYQDFKKARDAGRITLGKNDSLTVEYGSSETSSRQTLHLKTSIDIKTIGPVRYFSTTGSSMLYDFQNAVLDRCQSFYDILSGFGFAGVVEYSPVPIFWNSVSLRRKPHWPGPGC